MLLPSQARVLAPVNWQIGRRGETPDIHPGAILDLTTIAQANYDGSTTRVPAAICAFQFTAQEENGGHTYIRIPKNQDGSIRAIPLAYLWPRAKATADGESLLIAGLDDFNTVEELQMALMEAEAEYLASQEAVPTA